jgi:glycerate 2-kinase
VMLDAVRHGARTLLLGLGGSATVDGGCGAAAALGVTFLNREKEPFIPVGATLCDIDFIDMGALAPEMRGVKLRVLSDVENPLYGPNGAAYVFGPQKGADEAMVLRLDAGLRHLAAKIRDDLGFDVTGLRGAGAAGGMGAGMCAFLGGRLESGIDDILDITGFDREIRDCDLIYTGEGRLDNQSLGGKAVSGIARRARALGKPVVVISGGDQVSGTSIYQMGVTASFDSCRSPMTLAEALGGARENLAATVENVHRLILAFYGSGVKA